MHFTPELTRLILTPFHFNWQLLPLFHAAVFGVAAVIVRVLLAWRQSGASPFAFSGADTARELTARCFYVWMPLADLLLVVFYGASGDPGPLLWADWYRHDTLRWIGAALLAVSLGWVVASQAAMGRHWKMGVDHAGGALLVTGPFALSRHPVYTGIRAMMLGQLLVIGSWPMFAVWLLSEMLVQQQARFEEAAMGASHGSNYAAYSAAVRRWL